MTPVLRRQPLRRLAATLGALACLLAAPGAARAASTQATGTITVISGSWFTIQTSGRRTGVVNALVAAANAITNGDYPYVWGGGHPEAGIASAALGAKASKAKAVGFDCSGAVAAVLAGAGLWPAGGPVPNDAGVINQLLADKLIARGPGSGPVSVTLYDNPGVHIFANIDGRFFGTSDGAGGGSARGGPGWLYDGAPDAFNHRFRQYHVLPSVLKDSTSYGHTLTFQADPSLLQGALLGDSVTVGYAAGGSGLLDATTLSWTGALTTTGTVTAIAADGTSFTLQTPTGTTLTLVPQHPRPPRLPDRRRPDPGHLHHFPHRLRRPLPHHHHPRRAPDPRRPDHHTHAGHRAHDGPARRRRRQQHRIRRLYRRRLPGRRRLRRRRRLQRRRLQRRRLQRRRLQRRRLHPRRRLAPPARLRREPQRHRLHPRAASSSRPDSGASRPRPQAGPPPPTAPLKRVAVPAPPVRSSGCRHSHLDGPSSS